MNKKTRKAMQEHVESFWTGNRRKCFACETEYVGSDRTCDTCGKTHCWDCLRCYEDQRGRWHDICRTCDALEERKFKEK